MADDPENVEDASGAQRAVVTDEQSAEPFGDEPLTLHDQELDRMIAAEQEQYETYAEQAVYELKVHDLAASYLSLVISQLPAETVTLGLDRAGVPHGDNADLQKLKLYALLLMGVRGLRVARAARATLAAGYEPEARSHDRVIVELVSHRAAVLADESGKAALVWLKGKAGKGITGKVNAMQPAGLYGDLSGDSHGGAEPIMRMLGEQGVSIEKPLTIGPRRTAATRASLLMHAGFMRDHAVAVAGTAGIKLNGLEDLTALIKGGWARLDAEHDAGLETGAHEPGSP